MNRLYTIALFIITLFTTELATAQITNPSPYCTADYDDAAGFAVPHYISNVTLGTLNNSTGTVQFPGLHYAYYNAVAAPSLTQGSPYTLSVGNDGGGTIHFVAAYIDYNHNNSFSDPGELVLAQSISGAPVTNPSVATITIPAGATVGTTRMRIMVFEDDNYTWTMGSTVPTPCTTDGTGSFDWGETEDYNVNIVSSSTCAAVTGLNATGITSTGATISWTAVTGSIGYEYLINTTATAPTGAGTATTLLTTTAAGLTASTTYYAHVRNKCGATSFSSWVTIPFTTLATPACNPVTGITTSGITMTAATIDWAAVTGSIGYEYLINTTATAPTGSGTATTLLTASTTGLTAGTTYYAHVRNKCSGTSFSSWVNQAFTTLPPPPCNPVTAITASSIITTGATISWTAVTGSLGYEYVIDATATDPTGAGTATTTTTNAITGLTPATLYYAHVRNNCGSGNFSPWAAISFTTATPITCFPVTGLTVSGITASSATASWTAVVGSTGYEYAVNASAIPPASSVSTTGTTITVGTLLPGLPYYAHVRNNCGGGNFSAWETKLFATTLGVNDINTVAPALITAYPNPAKEYITLTIAGNNEAQLTLTDIAGKKIKTLTATSGTTTIDIKGLTPGIYLLHCISGGNAQTIKVVKE